MQTPVAPQEKPDVQVETQRLEEDSPPAFPETETRDSALWGDKDGEGGLSLGFGVQGFYPKHVEQRVWGDNCRVPIFGASGSQHSRMNTPTLHLRTSTGTAY